MWQGPPDKVPDIFKVSTLLAKVIGASFVVSTVIPLGMEGPMVHIGSIIAARVSSFLPRAWFSFTSADVPIWRKQTDLRQPQAQRMWVGMGAAAGITAAFQAPIGGILYAFEEVLPPSQPPHHPSLPPSLPPPYPYKSATVFTRKSGSPPPFLCP